MTPHLGYAIDTPQAKASLANPDRWPLSLLMAGVPLQVAPAHYLDPGIGPRALNQNVTNPQGDGNGACVGFAGETIKQAEEHADWGAYLFDTDSAFLAYHWLKHGSPDGSYPGDGLPGIDGSIPEQIWKLCRTYGLPDKNGKLHKISAYYSHDFRDPTDLEFVKQVILAFGPVNFGIPWPGNWFGGPSAPLYRMPPPGGPVGGHSITVAGWDDEPDGTWLVCVQTWGDAWSNLQGLYRIKADWLYSAPLGPQVVWKPVDIIDAPTPGGPDVIPVTDTVTRKLQIPAQTPVYDAATGLTEVVKLTSSAKVNSCGSASSSQFYARISTGGVPQWLRVNKAAVTVIASAQLT